jgi:glycine cleavage system H lipoate-binding protein
MAKLTIEPDPYFDEMVWWRVDGRRVTIGLRRDFVKEHEPTFIELAPVGSTTRRGEGFALGQFRKGREAEIPSPVTGKIAAINKAVHAKDNPQLVLSDPEGEGWLVVIEA